MALKTLEQKRAECAFNKISDIAAKIKEYREKGKKEYESLENYKSLVRGFSSMILLNGLGQALAFLRAKGKDDWNNHHNLLYQHINLWLRKHLREGESFDILGKIREEDSYKYRLYTKETLAFLVWLKKFAEAELPDKPDKK